MSEITHHRQLSVNISNFLFIFLRFLIDFHPIFFVQLFACQACIENDANKTSLSNVQKREPAPRMHNYCIVKWNTHTHTEVVRFISDVSVRVCSSASICVWVLGFLFVILKWVWNVHQHEVPLSTRLNSIVNRFVYILEFPNRNQFDIPSIYFMCITKFPL